MGIIYFVMLISAAYIILMSLAEVKVKNAIKKVYDETGSKQDALAELAKQNSFFIVKVQGLGMMLIMGILMYNLYNMGFTVIMSLMITMSYVLVLTLITQFFQLLVIQGIYNKIRQTKIKISMEMKKRLLLTLIYLILINVNLSILNIIYLSNLFILIKFALILVIIFIIPFIKYLINPLLYKINLQTRDFDRTNDSEKKAEDLIKGLFEEYNIKKYVLKVWDSEDSKIANAIVFSVFKEYMNVSTYLINNVNEDELKAIIMHEIAHIKNEDMKKRLRFKIKKLFIDIVVIMVLTIIASFVASLTGLSLTLVPVFFLLYAFIFVKLTAISNRRQMYMKQEQERNADLYALSKKISSEVYISALTKLNNLNDTQKKQDENIQKLATHPDLEMRIKYITKYEENRRKESEEEANKNIEK